MFSRKINHKCLICKVWQSDLFAWEVLNELGVTLLMWLLWKVIQQPQFSLLIWKRRGVWDWKMNTLHKMIYDWVVDKEDFGEVTAYCVWKDSSDIWPSHWTYHSCFLRRNRGNQIHIGSKYTLQVKVLLLYHVYLVTEERWREKIGYFSSVFQHFDKCSTHFLARYLPNFLVFLLLSYLLYAVSNIYATIWW